MKTLIRACHLMSSSNASQELYKCEKAKGHDIKRFENMVSYQNNSVQSNQHRDDACCGSFLRAPYIDCLGQHFDANTRTTAMPKRRRRCHRGTRIKRLVPTSIPCVALLRSALLAVMIFKTSLPSRVVAFSRIVPTSQFLGGKHSSTASSISISSSTTRATARNGLPFFSGLMRLHTCFNANSLHVKNTLEFALKCKFMEESETCNNDFNGQTKLESDQRDDLDGFYEEDDDDDDEEDDEFPSSPLLDMQINNFINDDNDEYLSLPSKEELQSMTVTQLKQQLRLRGMKVSGKKGDLVERLLSRGRNESGSNGMKNSSDASVASRISKDGMTFSKYQKPYRPQPSPLLDDLDEDNEKSTDELSSANEKQQKNQRRKQQISSSKKINAAKARGADIVDVTEYIDKEDEGKAFRSSERRVVDAEVVNPITEDDPSASDDHPEQKSSSASSNPEVWGEDAKIVQDYEGRSIIVDNLSRTIIQYTGANQTTVQAYVVASRDALQNFLRGGDAASSLQKNTTKSPKYATAEEEVYAIQRKRELESRKGMIRPEEADGAEDAPSDPGTRVYGAVERDYGDWGVYTPTGAQLSSAEVQGVLLLSDVYGAFAEDTRALADKIAFECQPVVVLVPDLFRGRPWAPVEEGDGEDDGMERNAEGQTYEEWRASHPDVRVDVDIRAAAAVLRERYAVSSIAVWGTCYGGGRALEAAAGWYPGGGVDAYLEDIYNGARPPPPQVDPIACVAWYPTRYDARKLFGKNNEGFSTFDDGKDRSVAVMVIFAENDSLPGATPEDAKLLKQCLDEDRRIKDAMVKVFPDQTHGFAHIGLGSGMNGRTNGNEESGENDGGSFLGDDFGSDMPDLNFNGDAEVACLLSTAWMETYTRVFLPTVGSPVRDDEDERWWTLEMKGYSRRDKEDIRKELEDAISNYEGVEVDFRRMPQSRSPLMDEDNDAVRELDRIEEEREQLRQKILEQYDIRPDDDEETFDRKVQQAFEDGALKELMMDAYFDDSNDAYW
mmetsp:Transcript_3461/g.6370  ORF Transcript_3461/g.6370 Transcript_3461/m.6370 type:complete len:1009 (+) Transcript_3461:13-3039(+)